MLKIVMIGVILFGIVSCNVPTLKKPVVMYEINQGLDDAGVGLVDLNIRHKAKKVGKWVNKNDVVFKSLNELPNLLKCFSQEDWEIKIVPKLKEGARAYRDFKD